MNTNNLPELAESRYLYYDDEYEFLVAWHGGTTFTVYSKELDIIEEFNRSEDGLPNKEHVGHNSVRAHLDEIMKDCVDEIKYESESHMNLSEKFE